MALSLKGKFEERLELTKVFGIEGVRIVEHDGIPIINPTNKILSKYIEGYKEQEEERSYIQEVEITYGYTDIISHGGLKRLKQEEYSMISGKELESVTAPEKMNMIKVSFLVETLGSIKLRKLLTFRFFDALNITSIGDKVQVFNSYGQVAYRDAEGNTPEFFINTKEANVQSVPMSRGHLDFQDMINFIYAYSTLKTDKQAPLMGEVNMEELINGNVSSLEKLFTAIHSDIKSESGICLYGAAVLFMVTNNQGTKSRSVQDFFHVFERFITTAKGDENKEFSYIITEINRMNKPAADGRVYNLQSKGTYVGVNNVPKRGLKEFKQEYMEGVMNMRVQKSQSANPGVGSGVPAFSTDFESFD